MTTMVAINTSFYIFNQVWQILIYSIKCDKYLSIQAWQLHISGYGVAAHVCNVHTL